MMLTALVVGVAALLMSAAPALAAFTENAGQDGTWNGMATHWGTMTVNGTDGFCVDPGAAAPTSLDNATKVCGSTDAAGNPDLVGQMAYLIARYHSTGDNQIAASVSQFARAQYHQGIPVFYPDLYNQLAGEAVRNGGNHDALVQVDADNLTIWYGLVRPGETDKASAHFADGFTATLTITTPNATFSDGSTTTTVTTGSTAQSVTFVPTHPLIAGEQVSVSISIADVPQSCYLLYDNGNTQQRFAVPLTTTVNGSGTGTATKTVWQPQVSTQISQTVLAVGAASVTDLVKADATGGTQWPVKTWADPAQTQPATYYPLTASGQIVKTQAPVAASATLPAGATVLPGKPTLVSLAGPGVAATTDVPLPADPGSGYYALHWCLDAQYQGGNAKYLPDGGPFCDDYFSTDERFTVPMRIAVSSALPVQYQAAGKAPDDTVTLSLPDNADQWMAGTDGKPVTVKVEGTYYAGAKSSFTLANTPPPDATVLGTASVSVTLPILGRDPVTVAAPAGFTVPTSQYGVWVWRIDPDHQTDAARVLIAASVADKFGQTAETHVTQMALTVQSQTQDTAVTEPTGDAAAKVCDNVWVEQANPDDLWLDQWGTNKPVEVTVNGALHHSAVPAQQVTTLDTGTPTVDDYTLTFTAAGKDHAQTVCTPVGFGDYGAYGFQWTIDPMGQPDATKDYLSSGTVTPLWLPVETTMVKRTPLIHSAASTWNTTVGGQASVYLSDALWQDDWPDGPSGTDMTGAIQHGQWSGLDGWPADVKTVTVQLWRIEGTVGPDSCTTGNPNATLVASNDLTPAQNTWTTADTVSGSGFKTSGGPASYSFVVSSWGDARTEAFTTLCGEPSETITVTPAPPKFVTQLVTQDGAATSTIDTAQAQQEAVTVQPGADLVDVLHAWFPDDTAGPQTDMSGWQATWDVYYMPSGDGKTTPTITDSPGGRKVYDDAQCTPDTLLTSLSEPVKVEQAGSFTSPSFTAPDQPGMIYVVETVTDTTDKTNPVVVERGLCGLVSESAIIPQSAPAPKITTQAPATATVGDNITDTAQLTGPYMKGDQVEFWYQTTDFINPDAPADQLTCAKPSPDDMTGATSIGTVTLDHDIAEGAVETLKSPQFTTDRPGCTFIKEIAVRPDNTGGTPTVMAQGWFGAANETTIWTTPVTAQTGGTVATAHPWWWLPGASALLLGGAVLGVFGWARRRRDGQDGDGQ